MKWIADENFPEPVIRRMRELGHDVASIREQMAGCTDIEVLRRAGAESRVLVTLDKDFGELAIRLRAPAQFGVILFRLTGESIAADNTRILFVIQLAQDWSGLFTVVTHDRIRMRSLDSISHSE